MDEQVGFFLEQIGYKRRELKGLIWYEKKKFLNGFVYKLIVEERYVRLKVKFIDNIKEEIIYTEIYNDLYKDVNSIIKLHKKLGIKI